jgi:ABC-type multidrug transport system fused ATPase/permease subunit
MARLLQTAIIRASRVLSPQDRKKVLAASLLQISLGILDLFGVLAIGLLGALSVSGIQSKTPDSRILAILRFLHIQGRDFQSQAIIVASIAILLLLGRTIISVLFTRRILFFLSRRGATISSNLISRLLAQPLMSVQKLTTQETLYAVTTGVGIITLLVLANTVVLVADISMLVVLMIGLILIDPVTAVGTFIVFVLTGYVLYRVLSVRAHSIGVESSKLHIRSSEKIVEVFSSYRESVVRNRRSYYAREIGETRLKLANFSAEQSFLPYVSKYVVEAVVVIGAMLLGVTQFLLEDTTQAVSTIAIFLAAGSRIAPAVLRVQQSAVQIRGGLAAALPTLDLIESLGDLPLQENTNDEVTGIHAGFNPEIHISNASFTYPDKSTPTISDVSLRIPAGASFAVVGPSGAGKTTLIDILLGVLQPESGQVLISNSPPLNAIRNWPGAIAYVPQDVAIINGTVRENVALGYPITTASDELVMRAIEIAQLSEFLEALPFGLETEVGERGAKISGGERQRLGIARAMFTMPKVLVLDEATSSLDAKSEMQLSLAIRGLRGSTTVVMIAHRLSSIKNVDFISYLSKGEVLCTGTFDEVRKAVPDFDKQAKLMGL